MGCSAHRCENVMRGPVGFNFDFHVLLYCGIVANSAINERVVNSLSDGMW